MAVKPENQYIAKIHKLVPPEVYRMKTHNPYVAGIPDCYYSGNKDALWVEYKFIVKLPVNVPVAINLSALQKAWLESRYGEGRNVAVIVGSPEGAVILHPPQLNQEITAYDFRETMLAPQDVAGWIARQTTKR